MKENLAPGLIGLGATLLSILTVGRIFGQDKMVIPAMVLILAVLTLGRKKL